MKHRKSLKHDQGTGHRRTLADDQSGVAVYFIQAIILLIVSGIVWYVGNEILFGEHGIGTYYENRIPEDQRPTDDTYRWVWNTWPIVVLIGAAAYTILASQIREPRTFQGGYPY